MAKQVLMHHIDARMILEGGKKAAFEAGQATKYPEKKPARKAKKEKALDQV